MRVGLKVWWTSMSRHQRSCQQWRICLPRLGDKVRRGHKAMHQTLSLSHLQSTTQKTNQLNSINFIDFNIKRKFIVSHIEKNLPCCHLFLPFCSSVLKPCLDLNFSEMESF